MVFIEFANGFGNIHFKVIIHVYIHVVGALSFFTIDILLDLVHLSNAFMNILRKFVKSQENYIHTLINLFILM